MSITTPDSARQRAQRIDVRKGYEALGDVRTELQEAYRCRDWLTLGYESWMSYIIGEFGPAGLVAGAGIARIALTDVGADTRAVYFIQAVTGGLIKIGVARDPGQRLAEIQRMCPVPLRIVGSIPRVGHAGEADLHKRFAASRRHGEWFEATPELCDYIRAYATSAGAR